MLIAGYMTIVSSTQQLTERIDASLAPYAQKNLTSKGRLHKESPDPYRLPFQKDRDRIIHSRAFRRLHGKTQVFRASSGDHFRSRLTHSIEVSQIARDICRNLSLNEDLGEAIGLAHDLGHTPFGHAGEEALNECMQEFGETFEHNRQSRRTVEILEKKYESFSGLNLSVEVLDGLIKHRTAYDEGELGESSVEAKVVNVADSIAYNAHDIDDGIRGKIFSIADCEQLEIWKMISSKLTSISDNELIRQRAISEMIKLMISDIFSEAEKNFSKNTFEISFSTKLQSALNELQSFLMEKFYLNPVIHAKSLEGQEIIKRLFHKFTSEPESMPEKIKERTQNEKIHIVVKDFIAGMTDKYAIELNQKLK
jgi:dGTPase